MSLEPVDLNCVAVEFDVGDEFDRNVRPARSADRRGRRSGPSVRAASIGGVAGDAGRYRGRGAARNSSVPSRSRSLISSTATSSMVRWAMSGKPKFRIDLRTWSKSLQVLGQFERDRIHQRFEIARHLAPQHRLGDRGPRGRAAPGDDPLAGFVAQIDFLGGVARRVGAAERIHQRRAEAILAVIGGHASQSGTSVPPARIHVRPGVQPCSLIARTCGAASDRRRRDIAAHEGVACDRVQRTLQAVIAPRTSTALFSTSPRYPT